MELIDELRQLVSEWSDQAKVLRASSRGELIHSQANLMDICSDQLKTVIEAHRNKEPNLKVMVDDLPDNLKNQAG